MLKKDLIVTSREIWSSIDRRYKIAFFTALSINVVVFLVFIVHQPMHNHGILSRLFYTSPYEQVPAGRWFSVFIFNIFGNSNLMVLLPLVTISIHILGGILSVCLWDKNASAFSLTSGALLVSLYPAVMTSFNFSFVGPIFSGPHLLAPLALLTASSLRFINVALGSGLVCIMMATYQPGISIISTIFIAFFVVQIIEDKQGLRAALVQFKRRILPKIIAIVTGGILYKLSLPLFGIKVSATTSTIRLSDIPSKFYQTLQNSFLYLYKTQPELLITVKLTLLSVFIIASLTIFITCYSNSISTKQAVVKISLLIVLTVCLVFSTKAMYIISSNENFWTYRYNHSLAYLYMFSFFVLLKYWESGYFKNMVYFLLLFVTIKFSYANIGRQQVLLRAQSHYLAIANRILYRIETLPDIDYRKKYKIVRVGMFSNFQKDQLGSRGHKYDVGGDVHLDGELSPIWGPGDIFNYLGSKVKLQGYMNNDFIKDLSVARELVKNHTPWPAQDSVFIHGDMIIVYL